MNHSALEIFCSVAEELSITRAARRLGRVQSNVTTRIQQLEEELGVTLFLRDNKRLQLSPQGDKFLGYAKSLLALAEEARQTLHSDEPEGILRIGSMESTAASRLPAPLARYHRQWPQVRLQVVTGPSRQLLEDVLNRTLDCALAAFPPASWKSPGNEPGIETPSDLSAQGLAGRSVFREELMLALPSGHPPARRAEEITVRSLAAFRPGCAYRTFAENWLYGTHGRGAPPDIQEVGSYHAMLACVAAGSCVSFIPRSVIELTRVPAGIRQIPVATIDTWLVWRESCATPAFTAFRDLLAGTADESQDGEAE